MLPPALATLYVAIAGIFNRLRFAYELDPDEGYNLMKVMLLGRGYALYREIWSDQPPGYTYLGLLFVRIFGEHVDSVRFLTIVLTGGLVFAVADLLRRALPGFPGLLAGVAATAMLPAAAGLSRYSMAAMIGLPAISLAVLSLWAVVVSRSRCRALLVLAGVFFAGSLLIKLFTGFLLPLLGVLLLFQLRDEPKGQRLRAVTRAVLYFGCGFALLLSFGLSPAFSDDGVRQLYGTHVDERVVRQPQYELLLRYLKPDFWLYGTAFAGFVLAVVRRNTVGMAFGAFMALSLLVTGVHSPLWYHHVLLVSVPASLLAGLCTGYLLEWFARRLRGIGRVAGFAAVGAGLVAVVVPLVQTKMTDEERKARKERELALDAAVRRYAPRAKLMVTGRQIRAFRLGIPMPPELAVTSRKRFVSGQLSADRIRQIIVAQRPDVVIVDERWPSSVRNPLKRSLKDGYRLVYEERRGHDAAIYVRGEDAEARGKAVR
jgi:hypothetical protein